MCSRVYNPLADAWLWTRTGAPATVVLRLPTASAEAWPIDAGPIDAGPIDAGPNDARPIKT